VVKKFATGVYVYLIFSCTNLIAQGEIDEQDKIFYRNEKTFAFLLNSNGLGINYRFARRMDAFRKTIYDFDLVTIKHPKEVKTPVTQYYFTKRIIYGKLNEFYNFRLGIGLQNEMFRKVDKGGVSIRRYFAFGPVVGITKPIYYIIGIDANGDATFDSEIVEKFSMNQHLQTYTIKSKASYFKGFNEISFIPGLYGKLGIMFEFSKQDEKIHALDGGITFDAFIKKVPIMATENNSRFFISLFVSYRFGKVVNARFNQKKTGIDEILTN